MQNELDADLPDTIYLFAVNNVGFESSTDVMAAFGSIPLLQDTADADVWGEWDVTYRDVVILDAENRRVGVYNLTQSNLEDAANYDTLKSMLQAAVQ